MKFKALLVLFVGFLTSTSFCQAQSIWHPSYLTGASGLSNSKLERIEIKRKTTALVFALSAYEGEITLPKDVCLKAAGDSLPLLSAVAYKHKYNGNSARQVAKGETFAFQEGDSLRLVFPSLPRHAATFNFLCGTGWGSGKMLGIRTDNRPYPALLPPSSPLRFTGALPDWPRRYAPAIIRARVHGLPEGASALSYLTGNSANIKQTSFPEITDTCGQFCLRYELSYPIYVKFSVADQPLTFPLCPGDTITIDYDLNRAANTHYSGAYHPEKRKALHIRGGMTPLLYVDSLKDALLEETVTFYDDSIAKIHHLSYAEFRQSVWECHQNRLSRYAALPLSEGEREFLQLASEKAYIDRCNEGSEYDNRSLVNDFARLRNEKARLLGYPSYAAYVTADQMAETPAAVYELLNEVWTPALDRAKEEMAEMNTMLQRDVPGATFEPWDWWYYAEKVRKDKYALDDATLRPYFSLENVREGAFSLANRLYGITFRPLVAPDYHKDCSVYEVLDVDGTHLGVLYFDFFPRSGKSSGAWCTAFRSQRYEGDERIAPVVAIVCNFTPPTKLTPSLLTLDEVQTLFHEFGHGLHALFADVKYRSLGRVEGDFVELPSQIMENWATEPEVLRHYASNYTTGEVIPERLIKRIRESGKFNQGFIVTELVAAALTDMDIHAITEYEPFDVNEFEADAVYGRRGLIPQIQPRYRYPYFLHIFDGGYASGYYFYIWAQVLD